MKPAFQRDSEFARELKNQVRLHLASDSNGRFATRFEWLKAAVLILICLNLYLTVVFGTHPFWMRTLLVLVFSAFTLLLGLNVMHESVHGNYSKIPWINGTLALTFDLYGISSDLYSIKHTQFHHNYTNIFGLDGDITEAPLIRMSVNQPWKPMHRFQAIYTPLLYSLITITWPIYDLSRLITAKVGEHRVRRPNKLITAKIILFKMISTYLTYLLPIQQLGLREGLFFILLFHLSLGVILTLIFQVAHVQNDSRFDGDPVDTDWFIHQLKTSADFSTQNPVMNFLCGGLNFQAIHHLFPNVSYRHYPAIQAILKKLCIRYGHHYVEYPNFADAVRAHFYWLKELAKP
jgi:linoleoyl-CoA desaturase